MLRRAKDQLYRTCSFCLAITINIICFLWLLQLVNAERIGQRESSIVEQVSASSSWQWQFFGWGVIALPALFALLAWPILVKTRKFHRSLELTLISVIGAFFLLTCLAFWPKPADWPFVVGVGGLIGDVGKAIILFVEKSGLVMPHWFASLLALILSIWCFLHILNFSKNDYPTVAVKFSKFGLDPMRRLSGWSSAVIRFCFRLVSEVVVRSLAGGTSFLKKQIRRKNRPVPDPEYDDLFVNPARNTPIFTEEENRHNLVQTSDINWDDDEPSSQFLVNERRKKKALLKKNDLLLANDEVEDLPDGGGTSPSLRAEKFEISSSSNIKLTDKTTPKTKVAINDNYEAPKLDLLTYPTLREKISNQIELRANAEKLEGILADFNVSGHITCARPGPVITLFEFEPSAGTKAARVVSLAEDVGRAMAVASARIAPIPSRSAIGIEIPNASRQTVFLRALLSAPEFTDLNTALPVAVGETIDGNPFITDLATTPHLLIAGTTGAGKSVGVNAMILSIMYRLSPEECRFILIDPKILELKVYDGSPHLLAPVVTEPKNAVGALKWAVREMEDRYRRMAELGVRNIRGYNKKVATTAGLGQKIPYLVVVIDEMADLMLVAGKEIEALVQRLAQMARAAGIHLIMATQRPSVDVITGTIKANFPSRVSYAVTSKIDSRTILGEQGAEQLLGKGDLLFMKGGSKIRRLHGPFVSDEEVEKVVNHLKSLGEPNYEDILHIDEELGELAIPGLESSDSGDDMYDKAVAIVLEDRRASTSYIQRRLQVGYNRAATLIEKMEAEGVIGAADRTGKREILVPNRAESIPN